MYSKEMASSIRSRFFTRLGQYMSPIPSATGQKVNWINYKTGIRQIYIRIEVPNRGCEIGLEICTEDPDLRKRQFTLLQAGSSLLHLDAGMHWQWSPNYSADTGTVISRVCDRLENVSVLNEQDWPALISFLKPRLIILDQFWQEMKELFI